MEAAAKRFFSSSQFAVVGASQDASKFGYKVLAWYHMHALPVTPINPKSSSIDFPSKSYPTVSSLSGLSNPAQTAVSIITPPKVTKKVLEEAKGLGIKSVWLQPGSFDDETVEYAKGNFESAVGGFDAGTSGGEGWCVLVDGETAMDNAGRKFNLQKL